MDGPFNGVALRGGGGYGVRFKLVVKTVSVSEPVLCYFSSLFFSFSLAFFFFSFRETYSFWPANGFNIKFASGIILSRLEIARPGFFESHREIIGTVC